MGRLGAGLRARLYELYERAAVAGQLRGGVRDRTVRAMTMKCPKCVEGVCSVARGLSGAEPRPHPTACEHCSTVATPAREINEVTVSLALGAVREDRDQTKSLLSQYGHLLRGHRSEGGPARLNSIRIGYGVGSELWRLLESLGIQHTPTCGCLGFAEQMNAWGVAGCRLARAEIVEHMRTRAPAYGWATFMHAAGRALLTGLAWRIDLTDPYGSLVDEAIRRAEADQSTHPGRPEGWKPPVAQAAPPASPAASNGQQEPSTEAASISTSKTPVPTHPYGNQQSEPPADSNAARTLSSGLQQSAEQDKERRNGNLLVRQELARLADIHGQP